MASASLRPHRRPVLQQPRPDQIVPGAEPLEHSARECHETKRLLRADAHLSPAEFESLAGLVVSQLDLSVCCAPSPSALTG